MEVWNDFLPNVIIEKRVGVAKVEYRTIIYTLVLLFSAVEKTKTRIGAKQPSFPFGRLKLKFYLK